MLLPPDLIFRAYPTLDIEDLSKSYATIHTCNLLKPSSNIPCLNCPAKNLETDSCGFKYSTNPDLEASMNTFYEFYPEVFI